MVKPDSTRILIAVAKTFEEDLGSATEGLGEEGKVRALQAIMGRRDEIRSLINGTIAKRIESSVSLFPPENPQEFEFLLTRLEDLNWPCSNNSKLKALNALNNWGIFYVYEVVKRMDFLLDVPNFHIKGQENLMGAIRNSGIDIHSIQIPLSLQVKIEAEIKRRKLL